MELSEDGKKNQDINDRTPPYIRQTIYKQIIGRGAERSYETVQEIESPRVPCCQIWIVVLGIEQQAQRYDNHHIYHGIPDSGCAFTAYGQQD